MVTGEHSQDIFNSFKISEREERNEEGEFFLVNGDAYVSTFNGNSFSSKHYSVI